MAKKTNKTTNTLVWILMGMLILGLGGFGATNFSGTVRSIGTVGDTEIPVNSYARELQGEIRALQAQTNQPVSFQQAQALGLADQVVARLVINAALKDEAARLGISVGDERLAQDVQNMSAFQGIDGQFDRETYRLTLENADLTEQAFEQQLRGDSAATVLQGAVLAGLKLPDTYTDTLIAYVGERRAFTWAEIGPEVLTTGLPVPSDADLKTYYEDNIADFTKPETRQITYAWLTPEMLVDEVELDEATLRAAYDERSAQFNVPERRLVERLVLGSDSAAAEAAARLDSGEITFEELVAERELELGDIDMGDVTREDLGEAAEIVFATQTGAISAPAPTSFGAALFRVNAVLAAQETSFEDAIPLLRGELALDRAGRLIDTQAQGFEDELAGGVTLEELVETTDMRLGKIGWTGANDDAVAGFPAFRDAASAVTSDDFPEIAQLGDGGVFALRLDEVQPEAPYPFDEVRDAVAAAWDAKATNDALLDYAQTLVDQLAGGASFESLSLVANVQESLTRNAFGAELPEGVLTGAFEMDKGAVQAIRGDSRAVILRLDDVLPADMSDENASQLRSVMGDQAADDIARDLAAALSADIQTRAGVQIDQNVLNAVHANFQ